MIWVRLIVGSRTGRIVVGVLAAILILLGMIRWWENTIRDQVLQEQQIQQLERQQQTRERIDEGLRNTPRSIDDIRRWLQQRQSNQ